MKKKSFLIILLITPILLFSQQTAGDFFKTVSANYSEIEAYTANFKFTSGVRNNIIQEGVLSYKSPNLLRLDYTSPENQVLNVNSLKMTLYVPAHRTVFEQTINSEEEAGALKMSGLTSQGLALFNSNYSISYLTGPEIEVLSEENPEEVYKLRLLPRKSKASEPFRQIIMSITPEGFIRRLETLSRADEMMILDVVNINTEVELTESDFEYESPATATLLTDFLFTPGDE